MDWLPVSAALLLTGALAFCAGVFLLPSSEDGDAGDTLRIVQESGGQWMVAATVLFLASVCLTLGLPAIMTLIQRRGWRIGVVSGIALEIGFLGTAGFAMLMVFFRALVEADSIDTGNFDAVASEAGLAVFLYVWIVGLYLGELLLALALLRARTTPRWVPLALALHVVASLVSQGLPDYVGKATALLFLLAFAGIAIQTTSPGTRRGLG
ncbi:hypothetical protein [Nocardioides pyridinolyticus]